MSSTTRNENIFAAKKKVKVRVKVKVMSRQSITMITFLALFRRWKSFEVRVTKESLNNSKPKRLREVFRLSNLLESVPPYVSLPPPRLQLLRRRPQPVRRPRQVTLRITKSTTNDLSIQTRRMVHNAHIMLTM